MGVLNSFCSGGGEFAHQKNWQGGWSGLELTDTLIEKASQIYVLVIFNSFSLKVTLCNWHKVNNVAQILISNVKLAEGPKRSSLFKSF